jgi:hypothetical protein
MYLFIDEKGCSTTSRDAKAVVFGLRDWILTDLVVHGASICCERVGSGVVCRSTARRKVTRAPFVTCVDWQGRLYVLNKDSGLDIGERLPMACFSYKNVVTWGDVRYAAEKMREAFRRFIRAKRLVVDQDMNVVAFSSEVVKVVDTYVKMVKNKSAKDLVVIL